MRNENQTSLVSASSDAEENEKFEMKQSVGLWGGVAILAGSVVGSGIFVSPVGVLAGTNGSVGLSLVLWAACGLFCGLAALCYAELGTSVLESGSEFAYLNAAYGGPIAFMYVVCFVFVVSPTSDAAKAIVFGTYLAAPFYPGCDPPTVAVKCAAAASVMVLGLLNYVSVKSSTQVQIVFTVTKFIGMFIIIVGGFAALGSGDASGQSNFENAFDSATLAGVTASQVGLAFYQGLFSYNGWNKLNYLTEEVKNVSKTLPRCIIIASISVTTFYVLVNVAYFSVLTAPEILSSKAVAVTFADRVFGNFAWIMPILVCFSVFGSLNGSLLSGARILFSAARRGHLPRVLSMVHISHETPGAAILVQVAMILVLLIPSDFDTLVSALSFTAWIFYGLCAAAVLVLRYKMPQLPRPYKVPLVIPIIVVLFALYLVVAPLVDAPDISYLYGVAIMICSPLLYYPFVHKNIDVPGMKTITIGLQKVLEISPTDWED